MSRRHAAVVPGSGMALSFRALALATGLVSALAPSSALAQRAPHASFEVAPGIAPVRIEPTVAYGAPASSRRAAWDRFVSASGSSAWQALWDRDTGAPLRIFGAGLTAPGTVADGEVAAAHARAFLRDHGDLLAPGVAPDDLELVSNDLDAGLRTVAFLQRAPLAGGGSAPVLGGRLNFRYRNDRLFVIAAEALPAVTLPPPRLDTASAEGVAMSWILADHASAALLGAPDLVALPLIGSGRVEVRPAYRVVIDAQGPRARWAAYVDAETGEPLAREELLRFEQATILFDTPVRAPSLGRKNYPAPRLSLQIDGAPAESDTAGVCSWTSTGMPVQLTLGVSGPLVHVSNQAGPEAQAMFSATDGAQILWSLADDEQGDAQLTSFIHAGLIKEHARIIAPSMTFLDSQLPVLPSESDTFGCNAFWDGSALNFYKENASCNNTARLPDVVYHEFGHAFHQYSIIAGAGAFDQALSEAAGDTMAASYTHDPQIAPGFYKVGNKPLRELDLGARWPDDINLDPHETGLIWGGAMWDLRTGLSASLGQAEGDTVTNGLYYAALKRASSIPTTYAEILAADDDDGDLSNGTPHVCAINHAFIPHGLAPVADDAGFTLHHTPLSVVTPSDTPYPIEVTGSVLYPQCDSGSVDSVGETFHFLGGAPGSGDLTKDAQGWSGQVPALKDGAALRYQITALVDGNPTSLPDNAADPEYRVFAGKTEPLYCNDFESQIDGWVFSDTTGGKGDFEWGAPQGGSGDPAGAFSGQKVIGDRLGGTGAYVAKKHISATSPVIDLKGELHPRLQLRRWLTVEDALHDKASIYVNEQLVWRNAASDGTSPTIDHVDHEWRFEDIDLSSLVALGAPTVQVRFELVSDGTRQLGGWNIDDFCVVAWNPQPIGADAGADAASDGGSDEMHDPQVGCACSAAESGPSHAWMALSALSLLGIARRRRRRSSERSQ